MIASQRCLYIMDQLTQKSVIDLKEIARALSASESTVRRDIERLEKQGKLKRVLGGAERIDSANSGIDVAELTMSARQKTNMRAAEKRAVAERAVQFVHDGDFVFVDGGMSSVPVIKLLARMDVHLVTNNQLALQQLVNPAATIISVGGKYLPHFNMTAGVLAEDFIDKFRFDHAFITCSSVNLEENMCYTSETETIGLKVAATRYADSSYLLIDSGKLQFKAFCKCMPLSDFKYVICDAPEAEYALPGNFVIADAKK